MTRMMMTMDMSGERKNRIKNQNKRRRGLTGARNTMMMKITQKKRKRMTRIAASLNSKKNQSTRTRTLNPMLIWSKNKNRPTK